MKSPALWRYLWRWTLWALAIAWVALIAASYYAGLHEAEEVTDAHLASAVNVLLQVSAFGTQAADPSEVQIPVEQGFQSFIPLGRHLNFTRSLAVLVWENGTIIADSRPPDQRAPVEVPDGYSTFTTHPAGAKSDQRWRVFAAQRGDKSHRAAAMINMNQRAFIGRQVALTIARPALIVLPLIAFLLWWAIWCGLRPLNALSSRVAELKLQRGERLEPHGFAEFASVVGAINGLIDRLQSQADRERRFASDVAHELRTPLAAIALQAQNALEDSDPRARALALASLQRESLRAGQILGELLDLARAQQFGDDAMEPVRLDELAASVMAGFAQSSFESGHTLELSCEPGDIVVSGNPMLLDLALRNLIVNALVHTARGTLVCVAVARGAAGCSLSVSDNGQRLDGERGAQADKSQNLGIGLSLVERIAGMHQARLVRDAGVAPMSTRFSIVWSSDAPAA